MKTRLSHVLLLSFALFAFSGCSSLRDSITKKDKVSTPLNETLRPMLSDEEKMALANTIADSMLAAINDNNYESYSKFFFKGLKTALTEKDFTELEKSIKNDLGEYQSRVQLGMMKKKLVDIFIWKARFSKSEDDLLIKMFLLEEEGQMKVSFFSLSPY